MAFQLECKFTNNIQRYEIATLKDGTVVRDYIKRLELEVKLHDPNRDGVAVTEVVHFDLTTPADKEPEDFSLVEDFEVPQYAKDWAKDWAYGVLPNLKLQYESQFNVFHDESREGTEDLQILELDADGNKPADNTPVSTDPAPVDDAP